MITEKLNLTPSCAFECTTYELSQHRDVCLEYTEHSSDHWHSDSITSIDIDATIAADIVAFLTKVFPEIVK